MATLEYPLMHPRDFPHGIRCGECGRSIEQDQPYTEKWSAMMGDMPIMTLVCVYC